MHTFSHRVTKHLAIPLFSRLAVVEWRADWSALTNQRSIPPFFTANREKSGITCLFVNGREILDKFHFSAIRFLKGTKLTMVLVFYIAMCFNSLSKHVFLPRVYDLV